ncbi:BH0509 family protein [Listeria ivanovii]|uniref:BH0509 family protein n=2 Tax=Listeria ivanovii TaxID=1638 RepID=A0ABS1G9D1_LISIV|nr:BH0509 family protein [Listeria ivanovii]EFR98145.1 conserved hypothetical protein [Listeria ivanovii FSL F6-596]MBK1963206.1 BH0509 family protein [Listeria ivanovii subsp. londoniensis]MBK1965920.1 BH0509 family protein [Listeria ivanovii subsp. londoniensis]MBK1984384.1 BH0509 family protein [Listeria ivanovii subsp. londoniensis]MBK1995446.1 BH0509 family protein [Listeria ivanovii subsp. londoniensis]
MKNEQKANDSWVLVEILSFITSMERRRPRELSYEELEALYERVVKER